MVMTRIPARPLCVTHYGPFLRLAGLGPKASGGRSKSTTTTPRLFHQVSVSDSYDLLMPPTYLGQPINDSMAEEPAVTPEAIEAKLKEAPIEASHVKAVDLSDGCGAKFDILVVSTAFQGEWLLFVVHDATRPCLDLSVVSSGLSTPLYVQMYADVACAPSMYFILPGTSCGEGSRR